MLSKKPYDSPSSAYGPAPAPYGPPSGDFGYDFGPRSPPPPPPGSYYAEEAPQHFYRWTSPPGLVRVLQAAALLLCIALFACVASTLAWDYGYGYGLYGNGLGGYYGSGGYYGGYGGYYGSGYYGAAANPRAANGFMMAAAVLCFLAQLGLLVAGLSKASGSRSRRFYLLVLVACAALALLLLVATIVYVVAVNPQAQMGGGYYYSPLLAMCSQLYGGGGTVVLNQYLYHYCTVEPQEAVAIVCGFLVVLLLCLVCLFAHKTRSKIWKYGKHNIYWDKIPAGPEGPDVEEWVKNVSGGSSVPDEAATVAYSEKGGTPGPAPPYSPPSYCDPPQSGWKSDPPEDPPSPSEEPDPAHAPLKPPARRGRRGRRQAEPDGSQHSQHSQYSQYDTDHTTAAESGDERDLEQWQRLYPPLGSPAERQRYKEEFGAGLRRYRELCAHMDGVNRRLAQLGQQLEHEPEDSARYQALAEEYNHLKDLKRSPEYQEKKRESQTLRNKLFHIKRMVGDYDKLRG